MLRTSHAHTVCLLLNCTRFYCENNCTITFVFFCLCVGSGPKPRQRPRIIAGPQNMTASLHYTVVLECVATGNPRPIISWSRADSKPIDVFNARVLGRWEDAWCTTVPIMLCAASATIEVFKPRLKTHLCSLSFMYQWHHFCFLNFLCVVCDFIIVIKIYLKNVFPEGKCGHLLQWSQSSVSTVKCVVF